MVALCDRISRFDCGRWRDRGSQYEQRGEFDQSRADYLVICEAAELSRGPRSCM